MKITICLNYRQFGIKRQCLKHTEPGYVGPLIYTKNNSIKRSKSGLKDFEYQCESKRNQYERTLHQLLRERETPAELWWGKGRPQYTDDPTLGEPLAEYIRVEIGTTPIHGSHIPATQFVGSDNELMQLCRMLDPLVFAELKIAEFI